jgi:Xaa-Pro aminopeptidase
METIRMKKTGLPKLIVADSEHDADQLYATCFFAPDPFLFLAQNGTRTILLSDLEIDRGRAQAQVDEVVALSEISKRLRKGKDAPFAEHLAAFLEERRVHRAVVPRSFPLGLSAELAKHGIKLVPQSGHFWPAREHKSHAEIKLLRRALKITEAGMARGFEVLRQARIGKRRQLTVGGQALTSERLRFEIDSTILRAGGLPANTIVAGGNQACDPHERGHGPLRAHELIIIDVFPRDARSGYFGDMTRTVVRGRASDSQRALWSTVLSGQQLALKQMRPGTNGKEIQDAVRNYFTRNDYPTEQRKGRWCGFFHGLGHGLGLEIHEEPRMAKTILTPGQVLTVEPGLYYTGIGGARHEDVVTITGSGHRMLSRFPKPLEI